VAPPHTTTRGKHRSPTRAPRSCGSGDARVQRPDPFEGLLRQRITGDRSRALIERRRGEGRAASPGLDERRATGVITVHASCAGPAPMLARWVPMFTVNGGPDSTSTIPFTCHPDPSFAPRPDDPPNAGSAQVMLPTKR